MMLDSVGTREDSAVAAWLASNDKLTHRITHLGAGLPAIQTQEILWIHIPDSADYERWKPRLKELEKVKTWFERGVPFLFTGLAAMIPYHAGIEKAAPTIEAEDVEDDWLFDEKGFQGYNPTMSLYRGYHPIFDSLFGGAFTWDGISNTRLWRAGYFGDNNPTVGKVVAVEKSYITIDAGSKLIVEYGGTRASGLSIGGFILFATPNNARARMVKLLENAIVRWFRYPHAPGYGYWPPPVLPPRRDTARTGRILPTSPFSEMCIRRDSATGNFYDVAGKRALVMGVEKGGIDELWIHPYRLLRDYRAGIISSDSIAWLSSFHARIEVRPESFTRVYSLPSGTLEEVVSADPYEPWALVRYTFIGEGKLSLVTKFRSDLRLMWPYDAPASGALRFGEEPLSGAFAVWDSNETMTGAVGADVLPAGTVSGQYDSVWWGPGGFSGRPTTANQVYHASRYDLDGHDRPSLTVGITAGVGDHPIYDLKKLVYAPRADNRYRRDYPGTVTIETPDSEFNQLFEWAKVGVDRFRAFTPGLGTALLAGYSTTARGWDGAQKISGRPGYAWYFGRDAEWSGFAIQDYGDSWTVREELEFLQRHQDITGKIFHEISTSGSVHFDAADATPLYVVLAGQYLRGSGDLKFLRESWPHIRRAMAYLYSTDTDGDGLIENTGQGHGWVEGGKLYPVHTEFYLAGAWCRALIDASYIASALGDTIIAEKYREDGERVRVMLNRDFWNPETKFFNFGKLADGGYNPEPTVLPATVMYFGLLDDEKVKPVLEQYAAGGFSTDWGVRIVSSASSLFNPAGYHYGSVWPLFTGWTALAEYEYGNSTQGFTHILNNMYIKNHWALGFVEEVMNGAVYQPSGVCPHQCWSESNILHPAIHGMIGWKPDAMDSSADLSPRFPPDWDRVTVGDLRCGDVSLDFSMTRGRDRTVYTFPASPIDTPFTLRFAPEIPEGMTITKITLDGRELPIPNGRRRGLLDPPIVLKPNEKAPVLVMEHTGGIGVVPMKPRPEPGDSSTGARIISTSLVGDVYSVVMEGRPGSVSEVELVTFGQEVEAAGGGTRVLRQDGKKAALEVTFPQGSASYVRHTVKVRVE